MIVTRALAAMQADLVGMNVYPFVPTFDIQMYITAGEIVIYSRPRVVARPVSDQCAQKQVNSIQARRDEEM